VQDVSLDDEGGATAAADVFVYDLREGRMALRTTLRGNWQPSDGQPSLSRKWRWSLFGLWVVVVLALPWVTAFAAHAVMDRKSNLASFLLLTGHTAADLVAALILTGLGGFWLVTVFVACATYNYWACERIAAAG